MRTVVKSNLIGQTHSVNRGNPLYNCVQVLWDDKFKAGACIAKGLNVASIVFSLLHFNSISLFYMQFTSAFAIGVVAGIRRGDFLPFLPMKDKDFPSLTG